MLFRRTLMKRLSMTLIVGGIVCSAVWGWASHNPGGGFFYSLLKATNLRIGRLDFLPDTQRTSGTDEVNAYLYVGAKGTKQAVKVFSETNLVLQGLGLVAKAPSTFFATGATFYGEAASGSATTVWGANTMAYTFSSTRGAVGSEVDGWNASGSTLPIVYGVNIVNGGNAATDAGLVIETANAEPAGKADYGIALAGPQTPVVGAINDPAGVTGILIDDIFSDEAIRIMENDRIALNKAGDVYIRFNSSANRVQFVRHGVVVASF